MFPALALKFTLCQTYDFVLSLEHNFDMLLCIEKGQTLKQVAEKPIIYLCVGKQINKDKVEFEIRNYFKESSELILLLGAPGELFVCPKCSRKMTNISFAVHLKNHGFHLVTVNNSTCNTDLDKKISRNTKRDVGLPSKQKDKLEHLLESTTIKSVYHSAKIGEKRRITEATRKKFVVFENEIARIKNFNQDTDPTLLSRAMLVQKTIRNAINTKRIVVIKKKSKKKRSQNTLRIFSGGLPGLGKRN